MPILLCFAGILRGDGLNGVLNEGVSNSIILGRDNY